GTAADILKVARGELGVKEKPAGSNRVKYTDWYPMVGPWCAMFVSWCAEKAGVPHDVIPKLSYTPSGVAWFKARGRYHKSKPKVGDIVYYRFPGMGRVSHVGIVEKVHGSKDVTAIEGNTDEAGGRTGGKVMRKRRSGSIIDGFGRPAYKKTSGGSEDVQYHSGFITKAKALKGGKWNSIPWDAVAAGKVNKGHPGIVFGSAKYDAKARFRIAGLAEGGDLKVRFVEMKKVKGEWKVQDTAAYDDLLDTAGDEFYTLNTGPDSL